MDMRMEEGFIKLHRKLLDSAVMRDERLCHLWIWCLLRANWKDGRFCGRDIPIGSFVCDLRGAAVVLKSSKSSVDRGLSRLAKLGQITRESVREAGHAFTVVSICNWQTYQNFTDASWDDSGTRAGQGRDKGGTRAGHIEECKNSKNARKEEQEQSSAGADGACDSPLAGSFDPEPGAKTPPSKPAYTAAFERFWLSYPRKDAKQAAANAYGRAAALLRKRGESDPHEFLFGRVTAFAASPKARGDPQYIPQATRWLNEGRYDDDESAWAAASNGKPKTKQAARSFD